MIGHGTQGVGSAHGRSGARIPAAAVDASLIRRTIFVGATSDGAEAVEADVTEEAIVVQATGEQAASFNAFLVECALTVGRARWNATSFQTPETSSTAALIVFLTRNRKADAFFGGFTGKSIRTAANGLVIFNATIRVHSAASVGQARISALSADASLVAETFAV